MHLQEGKNIEELLVGKVKHPVSDREFERTIQQIGFTALRKRLLNTLDLQMSRIRHDQEEKNPSNPKRVFAKNFVIDLDAAMGFITDINGGEKYDVRLYSAISTELDFGTGFDCWVELFDLEKNIPIADYKIDITTNPNKTDPKNLADTILYFNDDKYVDPDFKGEINPRYFETDEYKAFVELAALRLSERAHIQRPD